MIDKIFRSMENGKYDSIVDYVRSNPGASSSEIIAGLGWSVSPATMRRYLAALVADNKLVSSGANKGTRYNISPVYSILSPIDVEAYFKKEIDERNIVGHYNFELLGLLADAPLFTKEETDNSAVCSANSGRTSRSCLRRNIKRRWSVWRWI